MNAIKERLNQKLLSQLEGNIAIKSDKGLVYINGEKGTITSKKSEVMTTVALPYKDWVEVLEGSGNLGALIVNGKANIKGDVGLAFKLSDLIG